MRTIKPHWGLCQPLRGKDICSFEWQSKVGTYLYVKNILAWDFWGENWIRYTNPPIFVYCFKFCEICGIWILFSPVSKYFQSHSLHSVNILSSILYSVLSKCSEYKFVWKLFSVHAHGIGTVSKATLGKHARVSFTTVGKYAQIHPLQSTKAPNYS